MNYEERVQELTRQCVARTDGRDLAEIRVYARCCAAFEAGVNHEDVPKENAVALMTAALFEAADQAGFERDVVLSLAREHWVDVEPDGGAEA